MKGEGSKAMPNMSKTVKAVIFGTVAGILLTMLFTALETLMMVKMQTVPYAIAVPLAVAAMCLGALGGGYITARINQSMGMAVGALCGLAIFIVFLGLGAIFGSQIGLMSLIRAVPAVLAGAIGGILGVNKRKRRK